jgi:hypothetical protein
MTPTPRPELTDIPIRMMDLPIDERGYPVPWFVEWINGKPEFRLMNDTKWVKVVQLRLCWICGKQLGAFQCFVLGPMCGITRTTAEPPCHLSCARWAARFCPFLARPYMTRPGHEELTVRGARSMGGNAITRNPDVVLLWVARDYTVWRPEGDKSALIRIGDPTDWEWWAEGRKATRAEIDESIRTGLPYLEAEACQEKGGMEDLNRRIAEFSRYLPAE